MKKTVSLCALTFLLASDLTAGVRYVDSSSTNTLQDGLSWATAYHTLSEALAQANAGSTTDSIFVAGGTYFPNGTATAPASRDTTFLVSRTNIKIYGGYPAGGGVRDITANPTYLDGNINTPNDVTPDNSFHVMVIAGISSTAIDSIILDGLTFRNGNARDTSNGAYTYNGIVINRNIGGGLCLVNNTGDRPVALRNCTFIQNLAVLGGGCYNDNTATEISHCRFTGNNIRSLGGGIYCIGSSANITYTTFDQNTIIPVSGLNLTRRGAGMYNKKSQLTITSSEFRNNFIEGDASGAGIYSDSTMLSLDSCQFTGNRIEGNNIEVYGGAMYNNATSPAISHCLFTGNKVYGAHGVYGGAIYNNNARAIIRYSNFIADSAGNALISGINAPTIHGGAISGSCILSHCSFSDNFSGRFGGAIAYADSLIINSCSFVNNVAVEGGGISSNALQITGSTFSNNRADRGGAISSGGTTQIDSCTFSNNSAQKTAGGAILNGGNLKISNSRFLNDTSYCGGAICNYRDFNGSIDTCFIDRCIFDGNIAKQTSASAGDLMLSRGGAIYNNRVQNFRVSNSLFYRNEAVIAAGISNVHSACSVYNCVLYKNQINNYSITNAIPGLTVVNSIILGYANITHTGLGPEISYSLVQERSIAGVNHNLDGNMNPRFVDTVNFDFQLQASSPCINKGSNDLIPAGLTVDLAGNPRILLDTVDMGAYEFDGTPEPVGISGKKSTTKQPSFCYPNPAKTTVTLHTDASLLHTTVTLTDAMGRTVSTIPVNAAEQTISTASLPAGIYILKLQSGEAIKLIKQL